MVLSSANAYSEQYPGKKRVPQLNARLLGLLLTSLTFQHLNSYSETQIKSFCFKNPAERSLAQYLRENQLASIQLPSLVIWHFDFRHLKRVT